MSVFEDLQQHFMKFPGVGRRQAQRFAYFVATQPTGYRKALVTAMVHAGNNMKECPISHQHFIDDGNTSDLSPIERNPDRATTHLMIVEKDSDIDAVEKSGVYSGTYFVLGGLLPVVSKENEETRITELVELVENRKKEGDLQEIIIALSLNPESEHTRYAIEEALQPAIENSKINISRLGRGLSTGSELEYADSETLKAALESRK